MNFCWPPLTFIHHSKVLCASADGVGALMMGTLSGYTSITLLLMEKDADFEISEEQGSWIGAAVPGMAFIGSLIAGQIVKMFGCRYVSFMTSFPTLFAWICVALSTNAGQVIAARLFAGLCIGVLGVSISVFVSETVCPKLRPMFSIIPSLALMAGPFLMNVAGNFVDWRGLAWLGAATCLPLFLLHLYLPETPYFLLKSGKPKEALDSLKWLKSSEKAAQTEFKDLQQILSSENSKITTHFSDMMKPPYRWPFCMVILLQVFQHTTGINAVTSFMGLILERSGSTIDISTSSVIMTIVNIVAIFLSVKILEKYPRRVIIKWSSYLIICSLLALSFYLWARESNGVLKEVSKSLTFIPFLSLLSFIFGFTIGWGPLPWLFIGDGLPSKIRGMGASIAIATNWGLGFFITKTFSWATIILGSSTTFLIYTLMTFFGMMIMNYIPETSGFSDAQLEKFYKQSYKLKRN